MQLKYSVIFKHVIDNIIDVYSGIGFGDEDFVENKDKIQECIENGSMNIAELCLIAQKEGEKAWISSDKAKNMAVLRFIVHNIQLGAIFALPQATKMLRFIHTPQVAQRSSFRGLFEITPKFVIPVYVYKKCRHVTLPTLQKIIVPDTGDIDDIKYFPIAERKIVYRLQNDLSVEIDQERTSKGYKYGRSIVPESSIDVEAMKPKAERCLALIGFTDARKVPRQCFMSDSDIVLASPSDKYAYSALSAFIIAMAELDKYAICRYIVRKSAQPSIVALIPRKNEIEIEK